MGDVRYNTSYTGAMKTAISLPDDIFRQAEVTARRLGISRSKLYATAISEYLDRNNPQGITEQLNRIYSEHPAKVDSMLHKAQLRTVAKDSW